MDFLLNFEVSNEVVEFLNKTLTPNEIETCYNKNDIIYKTLTFFRELGFTEKTIEDIFYENYLFMLTKEEDYKKFLKENNISNEKFKEVVTKDVDALYTVD